MTAILFDGFDHGDIVDRWTNVGHFAVNTTPVRTGTHSARPAGINTHAAYLDLSPTEEDDGMYVGFGFYAASSHNQPTVSFVDRESNVIHGMLRFVGSSRAWELWRGGDGGGIDPLGTKVAETEPNINHINSWHYVELGTKIHDTTGWLEFRQDGVTRMRFDGDTRNGGLAVCDRIDFTTRTNGLQYWLDDVYILNEQGSVNNSWLGDTRCYPLYPNGNGTSSTPLSGSDGNSTDNYLLVDEAGTPVTTDYVFSQTDGDQDTYTFQDLPVTLGTIRGVEVRIHAAKDETGTKQIRPITRRLGSDSFGADKVLAAIPLYQTHWEMYELDPHAGPGAWTISTINDTEWGVEVRS